ncbi:FAD-dependent oxidoreductase [Micromonospora terminaliae]|uniref:FAD-dependent oxidoreductase n=1 Tax=Micromonospora terminaliae TaxID=1914461 RepID=UPI00313772C0
MRCTRFPAVLHCRRGADLTQRTARPDAVVVGGGVIGLTTAVCLAEAGLAVLVRTADPVEWTTSAVAGAMCGPTITGPDDPATRWSRAGEAEFAALAADPRSGVPIRRGRLVSDWGDATPPWAAGLARFAPCTEQVSGATPSFGTAPSSRSRGAASRRPCRRRGMKRSGRKGQPGIRTV